MIRICILTSFKEDNRKSMDIYSDNLCLVNNDLLDVFKFTPKSLFSPQNHRKFKILNWVNKYFYYPIQIFSIKADLYHIVDHTYAHLIQILPKNKVVVTVHDIIPILAYKNLIPGLNYPNNPILFKFSLNYLKKINYVITVSNTTKDDLINHFSINSNKISVIYNWITPKFKPYNEFEKLDVFKKLSSNAFKILIIGSLSYKNHALSFEIIQKLENKTQKPIQLILLKSNNIDLEVDINKYKIQNKIIIFENISQTELIYLYNSIDCLLFPSLYEGFGLPVIEAMACGIPVLISNIKILEEIANNSAIKCNNEDISTYVESILKLINDKNYKEKISHLGIENAKIYNQNYQIEIVRKFYYDILNLEIND